MIRPLRRRHRRMWLGMALVLPLLYLLALAARPPAPRVEALPDALRGASADPEASR